MVHIITHNDLDGYSAGYIVKYFYDKVHNTEIEHYNYDREPAIENFKNGDIVVITDYSLTNAQYHQILEFIGEDGHLIWLDHHITAIERYNEDKSLKLEGIHSVKVCGAALAFLYFIGGLNQLDIDYMETSELVSKLPYWLQLVDAWDTWKEDSPYRNNAEALCMGISNNLTIAEIDKIATDDNTLYYYINKGFTYKEYRQQFRLVMEKSLNKCLYYYTFFSKIITCNESKSN